MLCGENVVSGKLKIVFSVKVSRLEFVFFYPLQTNYSQIFINCHVWNRITKIDWKSTMYSVVKYPWIFSFILWCLIFSWFLILFIYIINNRYWYVLFIYNTQEELEKCYSATSTFKCWGGGGGRGALFSCTS